MFFDEHLIDNCPARLNFTMAHEFGHIILNHFIDTDNTIIMDYNKEREANIFVDELLMPTRVIINRRMDVLAIAKTYNVSIAAAQNKIKYLKMNALYKQEKTLNRVFYILNNFGRDPLQSAYKDYELEQLHLAWLDPDSVYER